MIPRSHNSGEMDSLWRRELASAFMDPGALLSFLGLEELISNDDGGASAAFPLRVPLSFAARMRRGDPADPLLLQVLPRRREMVPASGFVMDPVGDGAALHHHGLIRKYHGRALLVTTGACAIHCRYCFRRHFPYGVRGYRQEHADSLHRQIADDKTLTEIVLSGGDPLTLSDERLGDLLDLCADCGHVRRIRIHTRLPVVLPSRMCPSLVRTLAKPRNAELVVVLHINHAREIDGQVREALAPLRRLGITLLNQAVLLKDVNDSSASQIALAETCFAAGVLPYYLHLLDRVAGAAHFEVDEATATGIVDDLREKLPGYLVPRLVREQPGAASKMPVSVSA